MYLCKTKCRASELTTTKTEYKSTKKFLKITAICLISFLTLVGIAIILLNNSRIQRRIVDSLITVFEEKTGGGLSVDRVRLHLFRHIDIEGVTLYDTQKEKTASFSTANAHLKLLPLFRGKVQINDIRIDSLDANIELRPDSTLNIQYLIDAFAPQTPTATPEMELPDITVSNSSINYRNRIAKRTMTGGTFNDTDIRLTDINTEMSLSLHNNADNINATILYFNCREQSGLTVENISASLVKTDTSILLQNLVVAMPQTYVVMDSASIYRSKLDTGGLKNVKVDMAIADARLHLPDFKALAAPLGNLREEAHFSGQVSGKIGNLRISDLHARYGSVLSAKANIDVNGLPDYESAFYYCNIEHINFDKASVQDIVAKVVGKPVLIPDDVANLGLCQYSGNISGFLSNLVLYGSLRTDIGTIKTDVSVEAKNHLSLFRINGRVASNNLRIKSILPQSGIGDVGFTSNARITVGADNVFDADAKLKINHITFRGYRYSNININGLFKHDLFSGSVLMDDPNCYLAFDGMLSNADNYHNCEFTVDLKHFRPHLLNLTTNYPHLEVSVSSIADFEGERWENLTGFWAIDSLYIGNNGIEDNGKEYLLPHLMLESHTGEVSELTIASDLIKGGIRGRYGLAAMPTSLVDILAENMPIAQRIPLQRSKRTQNQMTFAFEIEPLQPLLSVLDIPWHTSETTNIFGSLDTDNKSLQTTVSVPHISNGVTRIDSIVLEINNSDNLNLHFAASPRLKGGSLDAKLDITGVADSIVTSISWDNNNPGKHTAGEIAFTSALAMKQNSDSLEVSVNFLPTELILQNKHWAMKPGTIFTDIARTTITNMGMTSEDNQLVKIDGTISADTLDIIDVALNDISLDYISELIPEETAITFGGRVTGSASIGQVLHHPRITADVRSERFTFNNAYFGKVDASCRFDNATTSLVFNGKVTADDSTNTALIGGSYSFPLDSLDLKGHANGLDIRFIDYYTAPIFGRVTGKAYGDVHVYGITKSKKVAVDVAALAKDASVTIDFLKNTFYFTDSIHLDKSIFDFGTISLTDKFGNQGTLKGAVHHNYFNNFIIDLNVDVNNMLVLNTRKADSENFYGTAYGTGTVRIAGDEQTLRITCKARTESGTNIVIPIDSYYASENSFITFVDHTAKNNADSNLPDYEAPEPSTNLILDIMIDVDPTATVQLLIDSKSGDMLRANGSGSLRITYDINADDIKLYGTYQIEQGSYLFTFQNLLRKEFRIREGSSIAWTGDPLNATIDIDAYYALTADLAEILDESILANSGRTSVPVQCLLNLSGILTQPTIKFDLHLPNSDEELNRALQNTVNTEEQMNRQIVSLLILGKFMNSEQNSTNTVFSQNELFSVVSSTLSSQLNNWASQMFDNWGFGVNFRTSGEGETRSNEYEFNFQYSPTKRWEITGNVGYRDDNMSSNPFIGDFDVTYKLIESGKLQAKAYTHTNDYREFKKGLTTQGIGLVYSENFNSLKELVQTWKNNAEQNRKENKIRREQKKQQRLAKKAKRQAAKEAKKSRDE